MQKLLSRMERTQKLRAGTQEARRPHQAPADSPLSRVERSPPPNDDTDDSQLFMDALEEQKSTPLVTSRHHHNTLTIPTYEERAAKSGHAQREDPNNVEQFSRRRDSKTDGVMDPEQDNTSTSGKTDSGKDHRPGREETDQDANTQQEDQVSFPTAVHDPHGLTNPEHVRIYNLALSHRWAKRELYRAVAPVAPVFLYCSLMLPWVLATVMGASPEKTTSYMVPAILKGFSRVTLKHASLPTLTQSSPETPLLGFLLGCVKDWALKKVEEYIGMAEHEQDVVEVEVETSDGERIIVAAYVYVWSGRLSVLEDKSWDPVEYMKIGTLRLV